MIRKEYWDLSKELIEFCNEEELKVLSQQAAKEINKRMDSYLRRFEINEDYKTKVNKRKAKEKAIKRNQKHDKQDRTS